MKLLFHLLYYKFRIFFSSDFHLSPKQLLKSIASTVVYSVFAVGFYAVSYAVVSVALREYHIGDYLFHRFTAIVLFIFALSVSAGNILVSLATMFRSRETAFLFTKPIPFGTLYFVRFLDNFFYSSGTLFLVLLSVLLAYENFYKLPAANFLLMFVLLLFPFVLFAGLTGSVLLMLIIQVAKKIGYRITLALIAGAYLLFTVLYYNIANPVEMAKEVFKYYPYFPKHLPALDAPILSFLPNFWVSDGMYALVRGEVYSFWKYVFLMNALLGISLLTALQIAKKLFYKSFLIVQEISLAGQEEKAIKEKNGKSVTSWSGAMNPRFASLWRKEYLLFLREPTQVVHLALMLFLILVFVLSVNGKPAEMFYSNNFQIQTVIYLSLFLFNTFLLSSLALRFVFPLFSLEGDTFWKIRSAPVNLKKYIFTKFVLVTSALVILGLLLSSYTTFAQEDSILVKVSAIVTCVLSVAVATINFSLGIVFADFKEKNPIRISSSQGASTAFLLSMLLLAIMIALLIKPLMNYFYVVQTRGIAIQYQSLNSITGAVVLFSLAVTVVFFYIGARALNKDF